MGTEDRLADWRADALEFESQLDGVVLGLQRAVRLLTVAVFARGHALLEGNVGVGKTTLLRAAARALGGAYQRIEGTIDLMPQDLIYHTHVDRNGQPRIEPGPILAHGCDLSVFFFNEINRARPQVHSLLLRVMSERSVSAFNTEYRFPHLQVFADRNRVEKEETFELPGAARDRFLMELEIAPESSETVSQATHIRHALSRYGYADRRGSRIRSRLQNDRGDCLRHSALGTRGRGSPAVRRAAAPCDPRPDRVRGNARQRGDG